MPQTLCLHGLWAILNEGSDETRATSDLTYPPLVAPAPREFQNTQEMFALLQRRDFLLHHPYDSFFAYVNWIKAACEDPNVTMIQQTVYRMDALSPIIEALEAAASRKKIRVFIELRARFDEFNNLRLAERLSKAGVEVCFGFGKLKLHAKIALVVRNENGAERLYTHLSTGNYNAVTARLYTDLAILTSNRDIGRDALFFFESVARGEVPATFRKLVPAPTKLHRKIAHLIDLEISAAKAGLKGGIVAKVNSLVDHAVIEKLYAASCAGVKVELIVRGACALIPGVKGLSENIRVISIVDRFLEHSRIYYFAHSKALYLSSADWMPRNFFSRLELAFPVLDERLYRYFLQVILPTHLEDRAKAKELTSDGVWQSRTLRDQGEALRSQWHFAELAKNGYRGTPLDPAADQLLEH